MTKDITDDVYEKVQENRKWVPDTSDMFTNILVVVPKVKAVEFKAQYLQHVVDFYTKQDDDEQKKFTQQAENRFKHLQENKGEQLDSVIMTIAGSLDIPMTPAYEEIAK